LQKWAKLGDPKEQEIAAKALSSILNPWGFVPVNCVPAGHGIVEQIGRKIRASGLIPGEEIHDSLIVAEAAFAVETGDRDRFILQSSKSEGGPGRFQSLPSYAPVARRTVVSRVFIKGALPSSEPTVVFSRRGL
jgi:hypothetical protein